MSDPTLLVLASLADGEKHGYAMMEDIERFAGIRLGPGTLYGAITRLEQRKWIRPVPSEDRRQPYAITSAGREYLTQQVGVLDRVIKAAARRLKHACKRLIRFAARLYPRSWRQRYGGEFNALLDDIQPDLRASLDILKGALAMQFRAWSFGRILLAASAAGGLVAAGAWFAIPKRYVSEAVVQVEGPHLFPSAGDPVLSLAKRTFSESSLTSIVNKEALYPRDRTKIPMERVIEKMKRNVVLSRVAGRAAVALKFTYDDPNKAQRAAQDLTSAFIRENGPFGVESLRILELPSLPSKPVFPGRALIALGAAGGMALGLILALRLRVSQKTA